MVELINKNLNKMKKFIKNAPENKTFKIEENKKLLILMKGFLSLIANNSQGQD